MKKVLYLLSIVFTINIANAQQSEKEHPIDIEFSQCLTNDSTTAGMVECSYTALEKWDAELNANYKKLMQVLSVEQKDSLKTSQRAWIDYRDKEQNFRSQLFNSIGGTMWRIVESGKQLDFTKERAIELEQYLEIATESY